MHRRCRSGQRAVIWFLAGVFFGGLLGAPAVGWAQLSGPGRPVEEQPGRQGGGEGENPGEAAGPATSQPVDDLRPLYERVEQGAGEPTAPIAVDAAIPTPAEALGFEIGERPIRHAELVSYFEKLDAASDRAQLIDYGVTYEGRRLVYLVISAAENVQWLADIQKDLSMLADPRSVDDDRAEAIIDRLPAVAWMAYTVHGDELSGTDAAVMAAYRLIAGRDALAEKLRQSLLICIDPLQNPDGRERFLSMMEQLSGRTPTGDVQSVEHSARWPWGRTNHYLFDLNRDWCMTVHPESRAKVAAIARWNPQLLVDAHEMGSIDTHLFSPPAEPLNTHIPPAVMEWARRYSRDQAAAFDRHGWSYYRGEWNEGWAIGFADVWAKHRSAVGILYEQARSHGTQIRLPTGQDRHYADDVARQYLSTIANLTTLADGREEALNSFYESRKRAVSDAGGKGGRDWFAFVPGGNQTRAGRFLEVLQRQGIECGRLSQAATVRDAIDAYGVVQELRELPAGTIVVSMRQPLSPLARSMLEFDPRMSDEFLRKERRELELHGHSHLYDVTAWCYPMLYDLDACWARAGDEALKPAAAGVSGEELKSPAGGVSISANVRPAAVYGAVLDGLDDASIERVGRLLQDGWKIRAASKKFTIEGRDFAAGSFLLRAHENAQDLERLAEALRGLPGGPGGVWVWAAGAGAEKGPDLGGGEYPLLETPRIALAGDEPFSAYSHGALWHLLDWRLHLRISRIVGQRLGGSDLRPYNVLILPEHWSDPSEALDEKTRDKLKSWMEDGGTLIAVGNTAAWLSRAEGGLGSVRRLSDVLDQAEVYGEAARRQRRAFSPDINLTQVWDFREAGQPTSRPAESQPEKPDLESLRREDEWAQRFMPRGVILRADLHTEHWLTHGARGRMPVHYGADYVLMAREPVEVLARLADVEEMRLSGLLWPEARLRLRNGVWLTREPMGRGQLILFAVDPVFRGFTEGATRLLLNAVILGPGLGASAPLPW